MKLKMPEYSTYEEFIAGFEWGRCKNDFPFLVYIGTDYDTDGDKFIYGYISRGHYFEGRIVESNSILLENNVLTKEVYEEVTKQLSDKYVKWIEECLYE